MKDNNHITEEILVKYVLGEASPGERFAVEEWMSLDRNNKNHVDELKLIWKESGKLAPGTSVTSEDAWERFKQRNINKPAYRERIQLRPLGWLKAAAVLLLLAGSGWLGWQAMSKHDNDQVATFVQPASTDTNDNTVAAPPSQTEEKAASLPVDPERNTGKEIPKVAVKSQKPAPRLTQNTTAPEHHKYSRTKEFICNATPCPLEICIVQTIHCSDGKPASIATCNLLQPDQAGQLHYKAFDKALGDCKATVSEIRIKRVTTGETIVVTNNSKPSTAEELFNYLTGKRTTNDDILAGIFETDCDNSCTESKLKIGNNYGHLTLQ